MTPKGNVFADDVLICMIDEWNNGKKNSIAGTVTYTTEDGADISYLSGYRSRNDFVKWEDMIAKIDKSLPWITLEEYNFSGQFQVFTKESSCD